MIILPTSHSEKCVSKEKKAKTETKPLTIVLPLGKSLVHTGDCFAF